MSQNNQKKNYVLDDKALISFLLGESSASYLISLFKEAETGKINVYLPGYCCGTIYNWAQKNGYRLIKIHEILHSLPINIFFTFDQEFIGKVIDFNEFHSEFSFGEAILLTLARDKSATIVTGDKNLKFDDPLISISWV